MYIGENCKIRNFIPNNIKILCINNKYQNIVDIDFTKLTNLRIIYQNDSQTRLLYNSPLLKYLEIMSENSNFLDIIPSNVTSFLFDGNISQLLPNSIEKLSIHNISIFPLSLKYLTHYVDCNNINKNYPDTIKPSFDK